MGESTRVTIETASLLIFRGRISHHAWCAQCAAAVEMIALEGTKVLSNPLPHELEQWFSSSQLHRSHTADGTELVCLKSLLARVQSSRTR